MGLAKHLLISPAHLLMVYTKLDAIAIIQHTNAQLESVKIIFVNQIAINPLEKLVSQHILIHANA
jgi:hypothetical protein